MALPLWPILFLAAGACLLGSLLLVTRALLPRIAGLDSVSRRGWCEGWLPLFLALPLACLSAASGAAGAPIAAAAGPALLAPSLAALVALALHARRQRRPNHSPAPVQGEAPAAGHILLWAATGLVMLLLAASDRLHIWQGQCLLTGAILLFWFGLPEVEQRGLRLIDASHASGLSGPIPLVAGLLTLLAAALAWFAGAGLGGSALRSGALPGAGGVLFIVTAAAGGLFIQPLLAVGRRLGGRAVAATAAVATVMAVWLSLGLWTLGAFVGRLDPTSGPVREQASYLLGQLTYDPSLWFPVNGMGKTAFAAMLLILAPIVFLSQRLDAAGRTIAFVAGGSAGLVLVGLVALGVFAIVSG